MIYAISYDLNRPGHSYPALHQAIKNCGDWWHYLESTWLVDSGLSAQHIWKILEPHIDKNDLVIVIGVTHENQG